ncbi:MAG: hypothetical protein FGM46_04000 [Ferruginibacter sp.]|nr:hypothetical protein [Ferruginibacter sp.]
MKRTIILTGLVSLTFFSACKKENVTVQKDPFPFETITDGKITTVKNLPADTVVGFDGIGRPIGAGIYSFYSLETNTWVPNKDSATTKWDLAFAGTTIRVNNQTSGPGNGGAYVYTGTFESLTSIPNDAIFAVDNHPLTYAIPKGSGAGWYNYDGPSNLVTAIPGKILVVRTASGKYAKVEILNYYRGGVTPSATAPTELKIKEQRFYTFRFTYQPDGSTSF